MTADPEKTPCTAIRVADVAEGCEIFGARGAGRLDVSLDARSADAFRQMSGRVYFIDCRRRLYCAKRATAFEIGRRPGMIFCRIRGTLFRDGALVAQKEDDQGRIWVDLDPNGKESARHPR